MTAAFHVAALLAAFTACNPSTARPPFAPLRGALIDTLPVVPEEATRRIAAVADSQGLEIRRLSVIDGFVELRVARIDSVASTGPDSTSLRQVTMRFWADPLLGGRTRITAEAVYRRLRDPSRTPRDAEAMVPPEHPSRALLRRIVDAVQTPSP